MPKVDTPKKAKWLGFVNCALSEDMLIALRSGDFVDNDTATEFINDAVSKGYRFAVSFFGYKADFTASLYGEYVTCPNAGLRLSAEAPSVEAAVTALIFKAEFLGLDNTWEIQADADERSFF